MNKMIAFLVILALLFTMGCAKDSSVYKPRPKATVISPSGPAEITAGSAGESTETAVTDVESDIDNLDDLNDDFLSDDLENLDSELDFEI